MIETFPINELTLLRKRAGKAGDLSYNSPLQGWSKSVIDPMKVLAVFKPIWIKEGFVLRAYQFVEGRNGNGFVWAMPVDAEFPEPEECPRLENKFLRPPKPFGALDNFMEAINGDGSPWSYLCASILERQLREFGVIWYGTDWEQHALRKKDEEFFFSLRDRENRDFFDSGESMLECWNPQVSQEMGSTIVTFVVFNSFKRESIYRYTDTYKSGTYCLTRIVRSSPTDRKVKSFEV